MTFLAFLAARAKAIAALIAPFLVGLAFKYGFDIDVNLLEAGIASVLSGATVHQVTNK